MKKFDVRLFINAVTFFRTAVRTGSTRAVLTVMNRIMTLLLSYHRFFDNTTPLKFSIPPQCLKF